MFTHYTNEFETLEILLRDYVQAEEGEDKVAKEALANYLNAQDMEFVKCIQVILHLGRNPQQNVEDPEALYHKTMQAFDTLKGWRPQDIEVRHMMIKIPLDTYFMDGLKVLGLAKKQPIETERLTIRPLSFEDLEAVYQIASDEEVAHYMRFDAHKSKEETKVLLEAYITSGDCYALAIHEKETGAFVGLFVFKKGEEAEDYTLTSFNGKAYWNKGYNTEILKAMKPYAKEVLGAKTLTAYVVGDNKGSCKVLEKNDFQVIEALNKEDLTCPLFIYQIQL